MLGFQGSNLQVIGYVCVWEIESKTLNLRTIKLKHSPCVLRQHCRLITNQDYPREVYHLHLRGGTEGRIPSGNRPLFPLQQGTWVFLCSSVVHSLIYSPTHPSFFPPFSPLQPFATTTACVIYHKGKKAGSEGGLQWEDKERWVTTAIMAAPESQPWCCTYSRQLKHENTALLIDPQLPEGQFQRAWQKTSEGEGYTHDTRRQESCSLSFHKTHFKR